jgi:hypothetical protein
MTVLWTISGRFPPAADQEHFYVNATLHNSGYLVETTMGYALKRI